MRDLFIVVRPDGVRSKPATKAGIREVYQRGSLRDDWTVVSVDTNHRMAVGDFIGEIEFAESIQKPKPARDPGRSPRKAAVEPEVTLSSSSVTIPALPENVEPVQIESVNLRLEAIDSSKDHSNPRPSRSIQLRPLTLVGLIVSAMTVGFFVPRGQWFTQIPAPLMASNDLSRIRTYLRESTNSGHWEEVRCWEPLYFHNENDWDALDQVRYEFHRKGGGQYSGELMLSIAELKRQYNADKSSRFIRLRYRTANEQGAMVVLDEVFLLTDQSVVNVTGMSVGALLVVGWDFVASHRQITDEEKRNARDPFGGPGPTREFFERFVPSLKQK